MYILTTNPAISPYWFISAQSFGFMLYVLGLGLAICVLDSITAR